MAAMAVLNFMASMSSATFLMVLWTAASLAFVYSRLSEQPSARFQTLSKKRLQPLTAWSDHTAACSKSPMNMTYRRRVSAP